MSRHARIRTHRLTSAHLQAAYPFMAEGSLGGAGSQQSVATYMVGDFFSGSGQIFFALTNPNNGGTEPRPLAEIPAAGGSRRVKISENNSPIPRDRIFYSYNGFDNAIPDFIGNTLIDVQRHTPGFEKTFLDGMGSIELRTPVAYTQNSNVFLNGGGPLKATEFGNISLALKMLHDGAMQRWLDLSGSEKGQPNENFARELMELFTLGVNNGYTEKDIREAARALTGFTYDYDKKTFGFDPEAHDSGYKTVFGHRGRFSPDDIVNLAVSHPKHAPYLCAKLWAYFTPRPVPKATLRQMVRAYVGSKTNVVPVLRIILNHPTLYADLDSPDQVKPPVVYAAGMMRRSGAHITKVDWGYRLDEMGQQPFYPPNVSGWEMDEAWLSPGTIRARFDTASTLLGDSIQDGSIGAAQTPERALAAADRALSATVGVMPATAC